MSEGNIEPVGPGFCKRVPASTLSDGAPIRVEIDGTLAVRDCKLSHGHGGRKLAVAVVHRDFEGQHCEVEFERALTASA